MGIEDITTEEQTEVVQALQRRVEEDWLKKCTEYPKHKEHIIRGRPKMTWSVVVERVWYMPGGCIG